MTRVTGRERMQLRISANRVTRMTNKNECERLSPQSSDLQVSEIRIFDHHALHDDEGGVL